LGEKSAGMRPKTPPTGIAGHIVPTEEERANLKLRGQHTRDGLKSEKGRVGSHSASKLSRTCSAQLHPASSGPGATPVTAGNRWAKRGGSALAQPCKYVLPAQALSGNGLPQPAAPLGGPRQKVRPMCTRGMNFLTWAPSPSGRKSYPRRKSHPMCTRGAHFLAAVRPRGSSLPRTPPRVYTRGGVSVIGPVSRQSDLPSLSENASRVYTRVAFSDAEPLGTLPTSSSGPLQSRRGIHWASGPVLSRATSHHDPPSEPFPCGGRASRQSGTPVTEGPLAANSRCEYS
jgi:hypothetical protein